MSLTRALGLAALALLAGMGWWLRGLEPDIVTLQLAFSPRRFGEIVHGWSPEGLARFRQHVVADWAFLACYAAFGWRLARRGPLFSGWPRAGQAIVAWLLPAAALCDATENALHLWLTAEPRFGVPEVYTAAATAASLKWAGLIAWALAVAWALVRPGSLHR